jgi:hypothetical protein
MGLDSLPDRLNGKPIDQSWFNVIKSALCGDLVPRDADGDASGSSASLGTAALQWLNGYFEGVLLYSGLRSVKIQAPDAIPSDYTLTLPNSLPPAKRLMGVDATGQMIADMDADNVTLQIVGNTISFKGNVTKQKLAPLDIKVSGSSGTSSGNGPVNNLSVTLTSTGRPVFLSLISDGGVDASSYVTGSTDISIKFTRSVTNVDLTITKTDIALLGGQSGAFIPSSGFSHIDPVAAGTYTYQVESISTNTVVKCKLVAFEL